MEAAETAGYLQNGARTIPVAAVVATSACLFYCISAVVDRVLIPESVPKTKDNPWKWKNTLVSFVHSVISGIWAVVCFYENPKMAEDMIHTNSSVSLTLVAVSVGYFIHDTLDMMLNKRTRQTYELTFHHCVIVLCFGIALTTKFYVGYAVVALLVELNSVFLHMRMLMQLVGFPKDDGCYRLNSLINLGTFIAFRIATLAWMTRWIVVNRDLVPLVMYSVGSVSLAIMTAMNIILFYRCLCSDFIRVRESSKQD